MSESKSQNWTSALQEQAEKWAPAFRMTILLFISAVAILVRVFSVKSLIKPNHPLGYSLWKYYSRVRSLVQLSYNSIHYQRGSLWPLELVRFWIMVSTWKKCRRYRISRYSYWFFFQWPTGLMTTSYAIYWVLHKLSLPVDIRNVCVFLAPVFAALTSIVTYLMTKEITKRPEPGLFAALFISIVPSYMSRSVAGSYDNEGVAIFALVNSFYTFLKAVNTVYFWVIWFILLGLIGLVHDCFTCLFLHGCLLGWLCIHH